MLKTTAPLFKTPDLHGLSKKFSDAAILTPDWKHAFDFIMHGDPHSSPQFQPVREAFYYNGDAIEPALIMLAKIALRKDSDYQVFKISSHVLEHFLNGENAPTRLEGGFWDDVRLRMKQRSEMPVKGHAVNASAKVFSVNNDKAKVVEIKNSFGFGAVFRR